VFKGTTKKYQKIKKDGNSCKQTKKKTTLIPNTIIVTILYYYFSHKGETLLKREFTKLLFNKLI